MEKNELPGTIQEYMDGQRDNLEKFLCDLINIKSLTGEEREIAAFVKTAMEGAGFDEIITDSMGNVVGKIGSGPVSILFDAHLDTVDVEADKWNTSPFRAVVQNGTVYGRGAADDKGPFAAIFFAGKAIKDLGLGEDVTVYISGSISEEDCEGLALGSFLTEKNIRPDYVCVSEASDLKICRGHRGRALVEARFRGKSIHASMHEDGDNPIEKALPFAQAVAGLDKKLAVDPELGRGDIVVTRIDSNSVSPNTVPSICTVIMDRRLTTKDGKEEVLEQLRELPNGDRAEIGYIQFEEPSYTGFPKKTEEYFPAWVIDENHGLIQSAAGAFRGMFGKEPVVTVWGFSTNGNYTMGKAEIPTFGFGPGKEVMAHSDNECIETADVVEAAKFFAYLPSVVAENTRKE